MNRQAELELKKQQLEKLRKERAQRTLQQQATAEVSPKTATDANDILSSLGLSKADLPACSLVRAETVAASPSAQMSPRRHKKLQISKLNEVSCPPSERINYCRETQTVEYSQSASRRSLGYYILTYDESNREDDVDPTDAIAELEKMPHVGLITENAVLPTQEEELEKEINRIRENMLTDEERSNIMMSENFRTFFDRSARIMERGVCEFEPDILTNYIGSDSEMEKDRETLVIKNREFFDEHWSRHRVVTSLDWSPLYPELLLGSYHSNEEAPHEPDGVCLIWNIKYKKDSPEYVLHCQSPLVSACMPNFHPSLVVGGTYSGQIVLWDIRTNKRTPIQRTPLNAAAHTHPVCAMTVIGTQNAHNLISVSSDGKMCAWSLEMLSMPSETKEFQGKQSKTIAVTAMDFSLNDVNNFLVGTEDGMVYPGVRHGVKSGLSDGFEGHIGPVSGLSCHKVPGPMEFSHLFLTSSFDWTVKLWSSRDSGTKPLHSFEDSGDYVYDVAWSPVHPGVFSSVDGQGLLDVWKLNSDTEVPISRTQVSATNALNKCRWHKSGAHIAVGDDNGRISIMDVNEQLYQPATSAWSDMAHTLNELQMASVDIKDFGV